MDVACTMLVGAEMQPTEGSSTRLIPAQRSCTKLARVSIRFMFPQDIARYAGLEFLTFTDCPATIQHLVRKWFIVDM